MDSFLTLGETGDEMSYFKQLLEVAQEKADNTSYAERRAQEMASGDMEEYSLEGKLETYGLLTLFGGCRGGNAGNGRNLAKGKGFGSACLSDKFSVRTQSRPDHENR